MKFSFEKELYQLVKIAPLLLLTFVENVFKHGMSQELLPKQILFTIQNSKERGINKCVFCRSLFLRLV
jgi:hypothetical protein